MGQYSSGGSLDGDRDSYANDAYPPDTDALDTPVDLWWWLAFFHAGKTCGKLDGTPLLGWRQHPRQHTRTHGRLSLDNLRRIKVHFLLQHPSGPAHGAAEVQVWSTRARPRCVSSLVRSS